MRFVARKAALLAAATLLALPAAAAGRLSFEDLVANLKSPNARTRQESAAALGKSRRREAIPPLAALVHDPDQKVRMEVVRALDSLRDVSAVAALVTAMGDGDPKIREEAIGALVEVYAERDRTSPVTRFLDIYSDEYDRASLPSYTVVDASVPQALGAALQDAEPEIRQQAALALGILNGKAALPQLQASLQDGNPDVRGAAATAIGKIGTEQDGNALIPLLSDDAVSVRNRAMTAIGVLRVKAAGPALRQLYEANRRKDAGVKILDSLSRIADPAQADLFRELVQDPEIERRRLAVEGLGRVSTASLLPALKKDYQREKNDEMRLAYAFAITLLGDHAFLDSVVLGLPSRLYGARCRKYLLELGPSLLPELYPYLSDPDEDVRAELCDIIAAIGDAKAAAMLQPLIGDSSRKVADRANRAVERLRRANGG